MARTKEFDEAEILNKALHIFWCRGYNGTSMQDLIDGLGISRSSLYDTYGDKRTLYIAALKKYQDVEAGILIGIIHHSCSVFDTIKLVFKKMIDESVSDQLKKGCFLVNSAIDLASHDKEIAEIIRANQKEVEDAYCKAIKKGQKKGEITDRYTARELARFIMNAATGIRVNAKWGSDKKGHEDVLQVVLSLLTPVSG